MYGFDDGFQSSFINEFELSETFSNDSNSIKKKRIKKKVFKVLRPEGKFKNNIQSSEKQGQRPFEWKLIMLSNIN